MSDKQQPEGRWAGRPRAAMAIKLVAWLSPIIISVVLIHFIAKAVPRPRGLTPTVLWFVALGVVATAILWAADKLARRLLPLAALLQLSLVFPDRAPSRFKAALRMQTVHQLEERVAEIKQTGLPSDPVLAAETLIELVAALSAHDRLTRGHAERVRAYSRMIGEELNLEDDDVELLQWAGLLHDVGKLFTPGEILNKTGGLTDEEYDVIKLHPGQGAVLCEPLRDWLGDWVDAVGEHHERWDGKGYPSGLAGEEISLAARIVSVADVYDVITSLRSYKPALSGAEGREELARCAGTQFDRNVVRAFLNISLGRLRIAMGPLSWLAQFPLVGQLPLGPAIGGAASVAATAAMLVAGGVLDPQTPPPVSEAAAPAPTTTVLEPLPPPTSLVVTTTVPATDAPTIPAVTTAAPAGLPIAVDDTAEIAEGGWIEIDVGLNDEFALNANVVEQPESGVVTHVSGTIFRYTSADDWFGDTAFTYSIDDGGGHWSTASVNVTVTPTPDAPVAVDDVATVAEDGAVKIAALLNDDDVDGDVLTIASVSSVDGLASIDGTTIDYVPTPGTSGQHSISYVIDDGTGLTDTALVNVTVTPKPVPPPVVPDPPAAPIAANDAASVDEDSSVTVAVLANDSDADGDGLTVSSVSSPDGAATTDGTTIDYAPAPNTWGTHTVSYTIDDGTGLADIATVTVAVNPAPDAPVAADDTASVAENGSVNIAVLTNDSDVDGDVLAVASASSADGVATTDGSTIDYTPATDTWGTHTVTYTVDDGTGLIDVATINVTVTEVNLAPVLQPIGAQNADELTLLSFTAAASDGDVPADALTFSLQAGVDAVPAGASIDPITGAFAWTPTEPQGGSSLSFKVRVTDDGSPVLFDEEQIVFTVAAVNDAPVANDDIGLGFATTEDTLFTTGSVTANDTDVDDPIDPTTTTIVTGTANGTLVNNGDGTFDYDPDPDWTGTDTFTYTITDPAPATSTIATVTVTVAATNDAPDVTNAGSQVGAEETPFSLQIIAADVELNNLVYGVVGLPAGLTINGTGLISGSPDPGTQGSYTVDVTVTDDGVPAEATMITFSLDVGLHLVSTEAGNIVINEVLYNTVSVIAPEEFIELHNRSASSIDVTGWTLTDANLKADGTENLDYTLPATDQWGSPSTLAAGEYAVVWVVYDGVTLPPLVNPASGLEYVLSVPSVKLADAGDDVWLLDTDTRIVDYMAYGGGAEVGTAPEAGLALWNASFQAALVTAAPESVVVTANGTNSDESACWEPTASDDANGRCTGALPTFDSDSMGALATSVGLDNNSFRADAGGPYAILEGDTLILDGSGTVGPPTVWNWDLDNDGQYDDASGVNPSVPWATLVGLGIDDDGVYPIRLEVDGGTGTSATTLTIANLAPVLNTTGTSSVSAGSPYTLNLGVVDPGDDTVASWTINWGDGTIDTIIGNPSSVVHTYVREGFTFDILASASDEDGTFLQNELLVPSFDGDNVFRFEATTGAFLQVFATADDPIETTLGPDGRLYVSGDNFGDVLRYNAQTGAFIDAFVAAGSGGLSSAEGIAFGPDGHLYVSHYEGNRVVRFNGTTGAFIDVFAGGLTRPYDLVFGPDSNLYVNTYTTNEVVRVDGTTGALIDVFVTAGSGGLDTPEQMTFGPDGNLYITSFASGEVLRYDGTTGAFIDVFVTTGGAADLDQPSGLAFGPDGHLYVGDHKDHVILRFHGATGAFLGEYVAPGAGGLSKPDPMTFLPEQQVTITG